MKKTLTAIVFAMTASAALAVTQGAEVWYIENINVQQQTQEPVQECSLQQVPVYGTVHNQHAATGMNNNVLAGAIIGGLIGGTSKGNDSGILPGAIIGGLLGSTTKGAQSRQIIGYKSQEVCNTVYQPINQQVQTQIVHWKYGNKRGYFYSNQKHWVGQTVMVDGGM